MKAPHLGACVVAWSALIVLGSAVFTRYEFTPGPLQTAPLRWPSDTKLRATPGGFALLLFLHPLCTCSEATIAELRHLEEALAQLPNQPRLHTRVVFAAASGLPGNWRESPTVRLARSVPGWTVVYDDGAEARRFGARTSGMLSAYGADGSLVFSGGVTVARGQRGENPGLASLRAALTQRQPALKPNRVFGCALSTNS